MKDEPGIVEELRKMENLGKLAIWLQDASQEIQGSENIAGDDVHKTTLFNDKNTKELMTGTFDGAGRLTEIIENNRMLFEISPEIIVLVDSTGNVLDVNSRLYDWIGYKPEEIVGKNFFKLPFLASENEIKIKNLFSHEMIGNGVFPQELNFIAKSREKRVGMVHISPIRDKNKKITGTMLMISDITENKIAEEEIHKLNQFQESIIDNANVWLSVMDVSANVLVWNKAAEAITGYSREEVIGHDKIWEWLSPDEGQYQGNVTGKGISLIEGAVFVQNFETIIKRRDGNTRTISWNPHNLLDNMNNPIGSIALGRDITDQKRYEEKIKKQNAQLKKLNRIKSDFLNVTSHELRTPMVAIKGYVQLLLDMSLGEVTEKQKKALDIVLRNTIRLNNLVQDILDISRLESGTMKFIPEKTDTRQMVEEIVETMQSSASMKEIKINADIEDNIPDLTVDSERIKQVIVNLVNNAIKFSLCGSDINMQARKEGVYVLFEVRDFGRGIPKNKKEKIFETFYQVDCVKDSKLLGGAGMGLAISRGIVIAHGGKIWVESKVGIESTFRFVLPIKPVKDVEGRFKEIDIFSHEECT